MDIQEKNKPEWLFRIDRVDISILGDSWRNWKSHASSILSEITGRFEAPLKRVHNGISPNQLYRRLVKYANNDLQLEVFYQRTSVKPECYVLARLRFTVLTPGGYNTHPQFIHHAEQILSRYGIAKHLGYAEVCLDTSDQDSWLWAMTHCVVSRAKWSDYGCCIAGEKRNQGFDAARRNLYVFWKNSPAQVVWYRKPEFDLYRVELRLRRTRLRNHGINYVRDLLDKGLDIFQSVVRLYKFYEDQTVPSAWQLHQVRRLHGGKPSVILKKFAKRIQWTGIEPDARPINNKQRSTKEEIEARREKAKQHIREVLSRLGESTNPPVSSEWEISTVVEQGQKAFCPRLFNKMGLNLRYLKTEAFIRSTLAQARSP